MMRLVRSLVYDCKYEDVQGSDVWCLVNLHIRV
jgi:hypothetical protein